MQIIEDKVMGIQYLYDGNKIIGSRQIIENKIPKSIYRTLPLSKIYQLYNDSDDEIIENEDSKEIIENEESKKIIENEESKKIIENEESKKISESEDSKIIQINQLYGDSDDEILESEDSKEIIENEESKEIIENEESKEIIEKEEIIENKIPKSIYRTLPLGKIVYNPNIMQQFQQNYQQIQNIVNLLLQAKTDNNKDYPQQRMTKICQKYGLENKTLTTENNLLQQLNSYCINIKLDMNIMFDDNQIIDMFLGMYMIHCKIQSQQNQNNLYYFSQYKTSINKVVDDINLNINLFKDKSVLLQLIDEMYLLCDVKNLVSYLYTQVKSLQPKQFVENKLLMSTLTQIQKYLTQIKVVEDEDIFELYKYKIVQQCQLIKQQPQIQTILELLQ